MNKGLLSFLIIFLFIQCEKKKELHITDFTQKHVKNAILIDVRTPEEFNSGHLEHAININWYDSDFQNRVNELEKDKTIYVYCKKGGRSAEAAKLIDSMGFEVIDLLGGYDAFTAAD